MAEVFKREFRKFQSVIIKPKSRELESGGELAIAQKGLRSVYFSETDGYTDCPVYDRYKLTAGQSLVGPAIVVEMDATAVIHPGYEAKVDRFGNLVINACE